jgi:hypothetical protein
VTSGAPAPTAQRQWPRPWVWVFGLILGWSLATWLTGGFFLEWQGLRVSSRNPTRPLGVALLVLAWAFWRYGRDGLERDLDVFRIDIDLTRWAAPLALLVSLMTLGVGLTWATRVAGGSDSWGYVSEAKLWAEGNLIVEQPIATQVEWPNASHSFAPLGYMPKGDGGAIVPTYPPGYPMLMALLSPVHPDAVFWVVPLSGALLVWMSYRLGQALGTPATGLLTSALVATSPAFLFQLVIPMSDVVVASLWVTALVVAIPNRFETWLGAGSISSLAILTRPNTAPIAAIFFIGAFWNWRDWRDPTGARRRLLKVLAYGTGIVPGLLSAAAIQTALYGGPFKSGYGTAANLFALSNFRPNLVNYLRWLLESETPIVCLAVVAPFFIKDASKRWLLMVTGLCAVATWLCYAFYLVFDLWWYLRFLLTAFPCILALTAVSFIALQDRVRPGTRMPIVVAILAAVIVWRVDYAKDAGIFMAWRHERRYADAGRHINGSLERHAILYSGQHSGSLRYYGQRLTLRWEALDGWWFDRSIERLKAKGYKPYFVLEDSELERFRAALAGKSRYSRLDWEPVAAIRADAVQTVWIYDPAAAGTK